ncbi:unnamed protein product [Mesocestoides corti]|uniref:ER membrane protein complex subunit 3 n=1 Tax=Mesocestoides corti TaxID=53468 RepID=A0A0R3UHK9_MESCO|nr:unnamed protein product [Mesocestoides corti]
MAELFLDSAIRFWVFFPIVIITFLFGVIRHFLTVTLASEKKHELQFVLITVVIERKLYHTQYPSMLTDMMKGNMLNVVPMLVIGGWINWAFSGFLTTKVPFPLTYRFKPMLQRGCETLVSLDASWVSSASWYFLNIFGLRSLHELVLGSDNAASQAVLMQDHTLTPPQQPQDMQKAFKAEWEAVEVVHHKWALHGCETRLS